MKFSRDSVLDRRGPFTTALVQVFRATKAGALYANIVFLIGFILGTIRVLLLAPRLGQTTAVILEAPTILAASWFVSRWCVDRLDVAATVPAGSLMGLVTFLVLMSGDFGLGAVLGRSLVDRVAAYGSLAGTIGLGAQVIFPSRPSPPITPPARSAHTRGKRPTSRHGEGEFPRDADSTLEESGFELVVPPSFSQLAAQAERPLSINAAGEPVPSWSSKANDMWSPGRRRCPSTRISTVHETDGVRS